MALDYPIVGRSDVASRDDIAALLRDTRAESVRLVGSGSSQHRLPPPRAPALLVGTARMDRIVRLDPGDLVCTVEPGLPRATLDAELARHRLVLPCPGEGSIGGLLARGEHQPLAPGALAARNVVLGLEGVLADGTRFKTGAPVVKSVAGFDVHRAFVGSRGRLFAATRLHLKLRPAPAARLAFAQPAADLDLALARFRELRLTPAPPSALFLERGRHGGFLVTGIVEGARAHVDAVQRAHGLTPCAAPSLDVTSAIGEEVIDGTVQPSALRSLLAALPASSPLRVTGTGQFQVALRPAAADALLAALPGLPGACGEIRCGGPARRGKATPLSAGVAQLEHRLRAALDPRGVLQ